MTIIRTEKELRPRNYKDFYPTQPELVKAAIKLVPQGMRPGRVLDPGCGTGVWGEGILERFPSAHIYGIDIEPPEQAPSPAYEHVIEGDFLKHPFTGHFDLIAGNPPYRFAEDFVRRSWELLAERGWMMFLLRLNFLASRCRTTGLFREIRPNYVYVLSTRPSFTGDNKSDDNEYALFVWIKDAERADRGLNYVTLKWFDWKADLVL